ncbi:hypothetical protein XELAEV_18031059mg [Xenopus laevis]|uniref:Uncharacterized protein n=1 Tax=Xenopus laevis TaxID=8355 RepID=A0A974HFC1_XENLA|nr:hypothetical protein XELAEV_18031059mg [Xenopus laevis]
MISSGIRVMSEDQQHSGDVTLVQSQSHPHRQQLTYPDSLRPVRVCACALLLLLPLLLCLLSSSPGLLQQEEQLMFVCGEPPVRQPSRGTHKQELGE